MTPGGHPDGAVLGKRDARSRDSIDTGGTLSCQFPSTNCGSGCVAGRYREMASHREVTYVEEKGASCLHVGHQRNQPLSADRVAHGFTADAAHAS